MLRAAVALQKHKAYLSLESFSHLRQALERKALQLLQAPRSEPNDRNEAPAYYQGVPPGQVRLACLNTLTMYQGVFRD
jgi:hypothetical protein